jgi:hypothetical protein
VAIAALSVSGCGSMLSKVYADPLYSPNRQERYAVHCDGTDHNFGDCRNLAQKLCSGAYNALAQAGPGPELGPAYSPGQDHRVMIVECESGGPAVVK